jgi:hypothetical protein
MSEELETGLEAEVEQEAKPQTFSREDWQRAQEEKASSSGWKDFDDYVAEGGDPAKWKTADAFNTFGELIGTIKQTKRDFEQRIEGVHKLSQAQIAAERARLSAERDQAIDDGNRATVHALDKQIQNLNVNPVPVTNTALDDWNAQNAWIFEDSPKSSRAKDVFGRAVASGKPINEAIELVEADIRKNFAIKREEKPANIPESERGRGSAGFGKGKSTSLSMSDLSRDEMLAYKAMPGAWKSEKEFLQAVADDRKAAKGGN